MTKYAWTTLLTSVDYLKSVLFLHSSLRRVGSKYPLVVIVTDTIAIDVIPELELKGCLYYVVPDLQRMHTEHLFSIDMLMKFYSFELTEYKKVCYLDGDILVLKNCDFIFNYRAPAAKYLGWDDKRPIHDSSNEPGQLAGEMMILEPGKFSMDYFFKSDKQITEFWDESVLQNYFGIQSVANIRLTDSNYLYHAHVTGKENKYWEKYNIVTEKDLDDFLNDSPINRLWALDL